MVGSVEPSEVLPAPGPVAAGPALAGLLAPRDVLAPPVPGLSFSVLPPPPPDQRPGADVSPAVVNPKATATLRSVAAALLLPEEDAVAEPEPPAHCMPHRAPDTESSSGSSSTTPQCHGLTDAASPLMLLPGPEDLWGARGSKMPSPGGVPEPHMGGLISPGGAANPLSARGMSFARGGIALVAEQEHGRDSPPDGSLGTVRPFSRGMSSNRGRKRLQAGDPPPMGLAQQRTGTSPWAPAASGSAHSPGTLSGALDVAGSLSARSAPPVGEGTPPARTRRRLHGDGTLSARDMSPKRSRVSPAPRRRRSPMPSQPSAQDDARAPWAYPTSHEGMPPELHDTSPRAGPTDAYISRDSDVDQVRAVPAMVVSERVPMMPEPLAMSEPNAAAPARSGARFGRRRSSSLPVLPAPPTDGPGPMDLQREDPMLHDWPLPSSADIEADTARRPPPATRRRRSSSLTPRAPAGSDTGSWLGWM